MVVINRKPSAMEKFESWLTIFLIATLVVAMVISALEFNLFNFFISFLAAILILMPDLIERRYKIDLPWEIELVTVLFVYSSIFLGEVHGYYTRLWWWDAFLHGISGLALAFVGFLVIYVLYKKDKLNSKPWLVAVFTFCFAVALGAVWEIFEFAMDQIVGTNMQKSGLVDTMWDLIVDSIGALIVAILGFIYIKYGKARFLSRIIERFVKDNPRLFRDN